MSAGLCSSGGTRGESVPCFVQLLAIVLSPWFVGHVSLISIHLAFLLCVCLICLHLLQGHLWRPSGFSRIIQRDILVSIYLIKLCLWRLFFQRGNILKFQVLGLDLFGWPLFHLGHYIIGHLARRHWRVLQHSWKQFLVFLYVILFASWAGTEKESGLQRWLTTTISAHWVGQWSRVGEGAPELNLPSGPFQP